MSFLRKVWIFPEELRKV